MTHRKVIVTVLVTQSYMMASSNGNIFRVTGPLCEEFTGPGEFPTQRPVTRSFDVFFDLRLNKRVSKQPWGCWFETPSWSLWRQYNDIQYIPRIMHAVCALLYLLILPLYFSITLLAVGHSTGTYVDNTVCHRTCLSDIFKYFPSIWESA